MYTLMSPPTSLLTYPPLLVWSPLSPEFSVSFLQTLWENSRNIDDVQALFSPSVTFWEASLALQLSSTFRYEQYLFHFISFPLAYLFQRFSIEKKRNFWWINHLCIVDRRRLANQGHRQRQHQCSAPRHLYTRLHSGTRPRTGPSRYHHRCFRWGI